jgi:hypothetical protein
MTPKFNQSQTKLTFEIDTASLGPAQVRLIKSLVATLSNVITTDVEADYFDGSAEFLRLAASLIQEAKFSNKGEATGIPYGTQALEYCVDSLTDHISSSKVVKYDN